VDGGLRGVLVVLDPCRWKSDDSPPAALGVRRRPRRLHRLAHPLGVGV